MLVFLLEEDTMNSARVFFTGLIVLTALGAMDTHASLTMTIVSETYHASGQVHIEPFDWFDTPSRLYSVTRSRPGAFGEINERLGWSYGGDGPLYWDDAGEYAVRTWSLATRYSRDNSIFFYAEQGSSHCPICAVDQGSPLQVVYPYSVASVTVDFTLEGPDSHLEVDAWRDISGWPPHDPYGWATAMIIDLTTYDSWVLFEHFDHSAEMSWDTTASLLIPVGEGHIYRLVMSAYPPEWHGSDVTVQFANANVPVVPAPAALLLSSMGAGLIGWLRHRKRL
jgi:hypothetical protein